MRLLAICPRIKKEQGRIVARTAWRIRLLTLGTLFRKVGIHLAEQQIEVHSSYLWVLRFHRRVPFSEVTAVTYGYEDLSLGTTLGTARDTFDCFSVGLRHGRDSEIHLFYFLGEGEFVNDSLMPDWMYWEDIQFDLEGSQQRESRVFVELLSTILGVPVVPPRGY